MAIIKIGDVLTGMRGSVGGSTYSANGSGTYVKLWSRGPVVRNELTQTSRARVGSLAAYWATLTPAEKTDWTLLSGGAIEEFYNSLGDRIYLSGWQLFCTLLLRQMSVGQAVDAIARFAYKPPVVETVTLAASSAGECLLEWGGGSGQFATDYLVVFAGVASTGVQSVGFSKCRLMGGYNPTGTNEKDFGDILRTYFGSLPVGGTLTFFVYRQQGGDGYQGLRSPAVVVTAEIEA